MIGQTIAHYRIVERLGSGGMGVVYKAVDLKLGRAVALKFLTEQQSRDHDSVLRFEREARAASALSDPSICTIYDIDEVDGQIFIAMELLEGESLHARLQRGPLPLAEALEYALQVTEALEAAHARGIWHRDIKPANIFLVGGRRAKVLDFGLAKMEEAADSMLDTEARPVSQPGTIAGTAPYMSPEQVLGKPLDARSDLFSFGLVLYEMTTGERVYSGPNWAVYEGILKRTPPPPSTIVTSLPPAVDRFIDKALQKDLATRYQSAADMRTDLMSLREAYGVLSGRSAVQIAPQATVLQPLMVVAVLSAVALLALAGYLMIGRSRSGPARPFLSDATFTQITDRPGLEASASLAPDGRTIVYASRATGNWDIYWSPLDTSTTTNLTGDSAADDLDPAYSPDGRQLAFRSERDGGGIFVMDLAARSLRRISNFCHNPSWSPDQTSIVCATERIDVPTTRLGISPLWILDVATGSKRQLTTVDGVQPSWSPHGDRIAYWSYTPRNGIRTVPAAGGSPVEVTRDNMRDWNPVWSPDGTFLFFSSIRGGATNLWRVPIDEQTGIARGPIEPVTTPSSNAGFISIARDGSRMTYVDQLFVRNFSKLRLDQPSNPPIPLTRGAHIYRQLDLSPDGTRVAFRSDSRIAVMDEDGGNIRQLTDSHDSRGPRWSRDGTRIAFYSNRAGANQIWMMKPDGSDIQQVTNFTDTKGVYYPIWSVDGRAMTCTSLEGLTMTVDLTKPLAERIADVLPPFVKTGMSFVAWAWSSDGSHLAGWKLLPDGRSAGIALYDARSRSYREITSFGIYPTWVRNSTALLFAANEQLHTVDLRSTEVSALPTPAGFALDFSLSRDERWVYYAEDQREGNVWLIGLPSARTPQR